MLIKLDSLEVQRRIRHHCDVRFLALEDVQHAMTVIDPDFNFHRAVTTFTQEVKEIYLEVGQCYVPERTYLAAAVLAMEDIFRRCRDLVAEMKRARGVGPACEGWCLRACSIAAAIEPVRDEMEEMRTELAKELAGPQMREAGGRWSRLKRLLGGKDLAAAKRAEGAFPCMKRNIAPPPGILANRNYW